MEPRSPEEWSRMRKILCQQLLIYKETKIDKWIEKPGENQLSYKDYTLWLDCCIRIFNVPTRWQVSQNLQWSHLNSTPLQRGEVSRLILVRGRFHRLICYDKVSYQHLPLSIPVNDGLTYYLWVYLDRVCTDKHRPKIFMIGLGPHNRITKFLNDLLKEGGANFTLSESHKLRHLFLNSVAHRFSFRRDFLSNCGLLVRNALEVIERNYIQNFEKYKHFCLLSNCKERGEHRDWIPFPFIESKHRSCESSLKRIMALRAGYREVDWWGGCSLSDLSIPEVTKKKKKKKKKGTIPWSIPRHWSLFHRHWNKPVNYRSCNNEILPLHRVWKIVKERISSATEKDEEGQVEKDIRTVLAELSTFGSSWGKIPPFKQKDWDDLREKNHTSQNNSKAYNLMVSDRGGRAAKHPFATWVDDTDNLMHVLRRGLELTGDRNLMYICSAMGHQSASGILKDEKVAWILQGGYAEQGESPEPAAEELPKHSALYTADFMKTQLNAWVESLRVNPEPGAEVVNLIRFRRLRKAVRTRMDPLPLVKVIGVDVSKNCISAACLERNTNRTKTSLYSWSVSKPQIRTISGMGALEEQISGTCVKVDGWKDMWVLFSKKMHSLLEGVVSHTFVILEDDLTETKMGNVDSGQVFYSNLVVSFFAPLIPPQNIVKVPPIRIKDFWVIGIGGEKPRKRSEEVAYKTKMVNVWEAKLLPRIRPRNSTTTSHPVSDLVDSYAMSLLGTMHFALRRGGRMLEVLQKGGFPSISRQYWAWLLLWNGRGTAINYYRYSKFLSRYLKEKGKYAMLRYPMCVKRLVASHTNLNTLVEFRLLQDKKRGDGRRPGKNKKHFFEEAWCSEWEKDNDLQKMVQRRDSLFFPRAPPPPYLQGSDRCVIAGESGRKGHHVAPDTGKDIVNGIKNWLRFLSSGDKTFPPKRHEFEVYSRTVNSFAMQQGDISSMSAILDPIYHISVANKIERMLAKGRKAIFAWLAHRCFIIGTKERYSSSSGRNWMKQFFTVWLAFLWLVRVRPFSFDLLKNIQLVNKTKEKERGKKRKRGKKGGGGGRKGEGEKIDGPYILREVDPTRGLVSYYFVPKGPDREEKKTIFDEDTSALNEAYVTCIRGHNLTQDNKPFFTSWKTKTGKAGFCANAFRSLVVDLGGDPSEFHLDRNPKFFHRLLCFTYVAAISESHYFDLDWALKVHAQLGKLNMREASNNRFSRFVPHLYTHFHAQDFLRRVLYPGQFSDSLSSSSSQIRIKPPVDKRGRDHPFSVFFTKKKKKGRPALRINKTGGKLITYLDARFVHYASLMRMPAVK